jgi:hypothetical protein
MNDHFTVYDNILDTKNFNKIIGNIINLYELNNRFHGYFNRYSNNYNNILEPLINEILDKLDDKCNFVEYWFRIKWINMECHQDINEGYYKEYNEIEIPVNGHILYLSDYINDAFTLLFNRDFSNVSVISPKIGRLVKFDGDIFHYIPRNEYNNGFRIVLLFNSWKEFKVTKYDINIKVDFHYFINTQSYDKWELVNEDNEIKLIEESDFTLDYIYDYNKIKTINVEFMGNDKRRGKFKKNEEFLINGMFYKLNVIRKYINYEIKRNS